MQSFTDSCFQALSKHKSRSSLSGKQWSRSYAPAITGGTDVDYTDAGSSHPGPSIEDERFFSPEPDDISADDTVHSPRM